ncbi:hypothetical protein [Gemmatimonas sp.]|jgi:hypothetical protein|uniref:hypothetical protein n=1 Tax=Gemmatimonas sp. TaxID=1962908 RepID=UPI0037BFC93F
MIMDRQIATEASVIAFSRIYRISGVLLVAALPLLLIWKTGESSKHQGGFALIGLWVVGLGAVGLSALGHEP